MNWRQWVFETLRDAPGTSALIPEEQLIAAFSLENIPTVKPFAVIVFGDETPSLKIASQQRFTLWVHDEPGSYFDIDTYLAAAREILVGQVSLVAGAFCCEWEGDSQDLEDDAMKTIVRTSSYVVTTRY